MAHFPDTNPVGKQQHSQLSMFVVLKIHRGIFTPSNFFANSDEKWLQLFVNILYFAQVHSFDSYYNTLINYLGSILVSPK